MWLPPIRFALIRVSYYLTTLLHWITFSSLIEIRGGIKKRHCCLFNYDLANEHYMIFELSIFHATGRGNTIWTCDLIVPNDPLYQLSYTPIILGDKSPNNTIKLGCCKYHPLHLHGLGTVKARKHYTKKLQFALAALWQGH